MRSETKIHHPAAQTQLPALPQTEQTAREHRADLLTSLTTPNPPQPPVARKPDAPETWHPAWSHP